MINFYPYFDLARVPCKERVSIEIKCYFFRVSDDQPAAGEGNNKDNPDEEVEEKTHKSNDSDEIDNGAEDGIKGVKEKAETENEFSDHCVKPKTKPTYPPRPG